MSKDGYVDILPVMDSRWVYKGYHGNGQQIYWEMKDVKYNFTNTYQMYLRANTHEPLRLHMRGFNFVLGSHPDEYVIHYTHYRPHHVDHKHFDVPHLCARATENPSVKTRAYAFTNYLGLNMLAAASAPARAEVPATSEVHHKFAVFMNSHKRTYTTPEEFERRFDIFSRNLEMINTHNLRTDATYKLGITQFTDMEYEEVQRLMNPNKYLRQQGIKPEPTNADRWHQRGEDALPTHVDWRGKGAVNPPKDQGACGSCWTFGTAGALEGAWAIKTGKLLSLSEQNILDCSWRFGEQGCNGGFAGAAMEWIKSNAGIATEADYPYLMIDGYCKKRVRNSGVFVTGHVNVTASEAALQDAVANLGPVSVAINAATPDFYYMQGSGIYNNPGCVGGIDDLDHEVLVIGYGTDVINGKNVDYWLLKNSWGVIWGDKGYWKMARGSSMPGGMCGVHQQGRVPLVGPKI